ncbi:MULTISPECIES: hypothetical protein [Burkholderia]|uniref:hypothetical protein n=1 Tax=Burkholderia TaxID=32008 RepID=UPI0005B6A9FD|nr:MULTISPECIES: hypothetical protein [Burkholderia]AOJ70783.1 hypothetical protein WS78_07285 [Burkholderia savannae]AVR11922.1 hypothetical protein A8H31_28195 [Burkholderia thailandensis]KIS58851.1 hypothetical protein BTP_5469 [Burkholderia thailandensis Phuket 4W-1]KVG46760.1 hypothetical protein WS77_30660 [Burkholderia sp. MSMB0265]KVG87435.1 hypothetical protein WS81_27740 [Burkholderia sp. MSMB2040]
MSEAELIERLIQELDKRIKPAIPLEIALWSTKEIGVYLQRPAQVVRERIATLPGFPEAIRLPSCDGGRGFPRWKAAEVVAWVESHQGGTRARGGRPRKPD